MARKSTRRRTYWVAKKFSYTNLGSGLSYTTLIDNATLHEVSAEPTIIRIRGRLFWGFDRGADTGTEVGMCWAGITCLHEDLTSVDPADESAAGEDHWMWLSSAYASAPQVAMPAWNGSVVVTNNPNTPHVTAASWWEMDVKAMRKAPEPCALRLFHNNGALSGSPSAYRMWGMLRILVKEG